MHDIKFEAQGAPVLSSRGSVVCNGTFKPASILQSITLVAQQDSQKFVKTILRDSDTSCCVFISA